MAKSLFRCVCLLWGVALLAACQSGKPISRLSDESFMYAVIYDWENSPVSGVAVHLNGRRVVDSDIQGRFVLSRMRGGEYRITLTKRGYETLESVFQYDPLQVLYFRMISASQLLAQAEAALDSFDFASAESYLDRALLIEPNRPDVHFLQSITYFLQGRNEEAASVLENLIKAGSRDPSVPQLLERIQRENAEPIN